MYRSDISSRKPCYSNINLYSELPMREIRAPVFQVDIPPIGAFQYKSSIQPIVKSSAEAPKNSVSERCGNYTVLGNVKSC